MTNRAAGLESAQRRRREETATAERAASPEERVTAFRAMAMTRAKELPPVWIAPLVRALSGTELDLKRHAVAVVRAAPPSKDAAAEMNAALLRVARDTAVPPP